MISSYFLWAFPKRPNPQYPDTQTYFFFMFYASPSNPKPFRHFTRLPQLFWLKFQENISSASVQNKKEENCIKTIWKEIKFFIYLVLVMESICSI